MKMKAKMLFFFVLFSVVSVHGMGIVRHTFISITEKKVMGRMFKHVMKSGNKQQDEFFVDGLSVSSQQYDRDLERAEKKDREIKRAAEEEKRRNQLKFSDTVQSAVLAKLIAKLFVTIKGILKKIDSPQLEYYFVFAQDTISSLEQYDQLKAFLTSTENSVAHYIANNDIDNLQQTYNKIEDWPNRLDRFFQESVQNAIQKSDDTTFLKDLLALVSED